MKRCGDGSGVEAVRDSVGGVLRFSSFASVIISSLVMTPFCSSNSPRAASSYVLSIDISTNVNNVLGSTGSDIRPSYKAVTQDDNGGATREMANRSLVETGQTLECAMLLPSSLSE